MSFFVTRLFQTEGVTPEIVAVSEFIASILGEDCAGDKDLTFLTLRVGVQCGELQLYPGKIPSVSYCTSFSCRLWVTWEMLWRPLNLPSRQC